MEPYCCWPWAPTVATRCRRPLVATGCIAYLVGLVAVLFCYVAAKGSECRNPTSCYTSLLLRLCCATGYLLSKA